MTSGVVRKTVTVVFADISGSTSLGERLDAEALREIMDRYFEEMRLTLERHGGTIEKFIGDAVVAVFGVPNLHENDSFRAVRAAFDMRSALHELSNALEQEAGIRLEARIGVNTGEVVAGDPSSGQTFVTGDCVNVAARLQQNASPGEILIGDATFRLVRDAVSVEALEPVMAKGKSAPVAAWRLLDVSQGAPPLARPRDAPMVGREVELAELRRWFDAATRERTFRLVTCVGPPGIGKSRLADEFVASIGDRARVLRGRCLEYGEGITYAPVAELVRHLGGAASSVHATVAAGEEGPVLRHLSRAIGAEAGASTTAEIFWAVRKLLEGHAREQPVIVVLDDIHWAEPTLLDLIEYLVTLGTAAVLLLCLARSELLDARPRWPASSPIAHILSLEPLSETEATSLLDSHRASKALAAPQRNRIFEAAGGNPLFLQQMLAMIVEGATSIEVPPTVHALLAARLERLPDGERTLLEIASVEGQLFHRGALIELSEDREKDALGAQLVALMRRQLIRPDGTGSGDDDAFRFDHVLVRDVAYEAMSKDRRADLHERVADWLERMPGEANEVIGFHLEQAFRYRTDLRRNAQSVELAKRAGTRLAAAGRHAFGLGDMAAAVNLLDRATSLLAPNATQRGELRLMLASALARTGDLPRCETVLTELIDEAQARSDRRLEVHAQVERAAWRLWREPSTGGTAHSLAEEAIASFTEIHDNLGLARSWRLLADAESTWRANLAALERAVIHARLAGDPREESDALWWIGVAMHFGPMAADNAIPRCEEILSRAGGDRTLDAGIRGVLAGLHAMRGNFDKARELYEEGFAILEQLGLQLRMATRRTISGAVELLAGDPVAAERELRWGFERLSEMGERIDRPGIAAQLAEALYQQNRYDESEFFVDISEEGVPSARVRYRFAVRAKLLARRGEVARAAELAKAMVELAEREDNLNMHGHALMDLAEVLRLAGQTEESRRHIESALDVYDRKANVVSAAAARAVLERLDDPTEK
ncbi:MAG TPA: adenylate/guanylate cyclase domain-containing protein [Candidatus Dormibacteraeota bacterium]